MSAPHAIELNGRSDAGVTFERCDFDMYGNRTSPLVRMNNEGRVFLQDLHVTTRGTFTHRHLLHRRLRRRWSRTQWLIRRHPWRAAALGLIGLRIAHAREMAGTR